MVFSVFPWSCRIFEIFIAYPAVEALLHVAIILFQLDECLAVACVCGFQTAFLPSADNVIVFRLQFLQQPVGALQQPVVPAPFPVSVEERDDCVDDAQVDCRLAECLCLCGRNLAEHIVGEPIFGSPATENVA